jgi:hypothetical protein
MFFIVKLLLFNMLFGFLIFGTCYVYFSTKVTERTKFYLMSSTFFLFLTYLMMVYFLHTSPSNFKTLPPPSHIPASVLQFPSFRMELKLKQGPMLQLDDRMTDPPGVSVFCSHDIRDIGRLVRTAADKAKLTSFYLSFAAHERDYLNKGPHILQGLKNDLLAFRSSKKTVVVLNGLSSKVIRLDFIGLLELIHQEAVNMYFVIIEDNEEVCGIIKRELNRGKSGDTFV